VIFRMQIEEVKQIKVDLSTMVRLI